MLLLMESVGAGCERRSMKIGKRDFALTVLKCSLIQWPTLFRQGASLVAS